MIDEKSDDAGEEGTGASHNAPGGLPPEKVEDRPDGSQVTPEDYPLDQRAK